MADPVVSQVKLNRFTIEPRDKSGICMELSADDEDEFVKIDVVKQWKKTHRIDYTDFTVFHRFYFERDCSVISFSALTTREAAASRIKYVPRVHSITLNKIDRIMAKMVTNND